MVTYQSFLKPLIQNIFVADKISSGIVFKPPIMLKTKFQSIAIKSIKITAPSIKWSLIKAKTTIGKNAKIGTDWAISEIGRRTFSVLGLFVIRSATGTDTIREKT